MDVLFFHNIRTKKINTPVCISYFCLYDTLNILDSNNCFLDTEICSLVRDESPRNWWWMMTTALAGYKAEVYAVQTWSGYILPLSLSWRLRAGETLLNSHARSHSLAKHKISSDVSCSTNAPASSCSPYAVSPFIAGRGSFYLVWGSRAKFQLTSAY